MRINLKVILENYTKQLSLTRHMHFYIVIHMVTAPR